LKIEQGKLILNSDIAPRVCHLSLWERSAAQQPGEGRRDAKISWPLTDPICELNAPVNLSAKTEYACLAMLELAARFHSPEPVRIREIALRHGVPRRFLVQILWQLKGMGLVTSTRGQAGGYQLVRPPSEVTLEQVMSAMEGTATPPKSNIPTVSPATRVLWDSWNRCLAAERESLQSVTFAELVDRMKGYADSMYYI
jgi:Rrf2 family protein